MPGGGLRLTGTRVEGLNQEYEGARARKVLDTAQRIQGAIVGSQAKAEQSVAQIDAVGRRTLQD